VLKARLAAEERAEVGAEHGGEHRDRVERRRDRPRLDAGEIAVAAADSLRQVRQGQFARLAQATQLTADVAHHVNPFDLTKVWPHSDYPLIEIGKMVLDRNPDNYFAEVEQAAFDPGHFVPGIGPSPDKMLQGRLFAYGDAHRYRLGINHTQPPINGPHATEADNYGRDGSMRFDAHYGREKNYEPNSFGGPAETGEPLYGSLGGGPSGTYAWDQHDGDDFSQAGALYRLMPEEAKARLVDNIASGLAQVSKDDIVERSIANFRHADPDYGARIEVAIKAHRR
jgi:catalase